MNLRKTAILPPKFWISNFASQLRAMSPHHLLVFAYLVTGPNSHISGLYRFDAHAAAEDTGLDEDEILKILADLQSLGWCDYESRIVWIRGLGNMLDQLGGTLASHELWAINLLDYIERFPDDLPIVAAFRLAHGLVGRSSKAEKAERRARKEEAALGRRQEARG
jgi:hypothetical protein